jgi:hypothetical protein
VQTSPTICRDPGATTVHRRCGAQQSAGCRAAKITGAAMGAPLRRQSRVWSVLGSAA